MTTATGEESLSARDYARLCKLIYAHAGIHLGTERKIMLEGRIKRRLKHLHLASFADYCAYLFGEGGTENEMVALLDVVTTNKTDFFREAGHFNFLVDRAVPEWAAKVSGRPFTLWSAGCSSGEEAYTMAMVLSEYGLSHSGFRFQILGTDVSTEVLAKAELGVYTNEIMAPVPATLRKRYFMRSRDPASKKVRVIPELRMHIEFRRLNFMDEHYGLERKADAIFCRNVIIYFDRPTQQRVLSRLVENLEPGGYLFVGHAETLHELQLPLDPVAPALYRKTDGRT